MRTGGGVADTVRAVEAADDAKVPAFERWEIVAALVGLVILGLLGARALSDPEPRDFAAYFLGADAAWRSGDPWQVGFWNFTPSVALLLAPLTILRQSQAAWTLTVVNIGLSLALAVAACWWLRSRVAPWVAWLVTIGIIGWAPLSGSLQWKQLNLVALALAVAGYIALRRGSWTAGLLFGLSIAVKPLALLVPLFLLTHRETRRPALVSIATAAVVNVAGLLMLAWRAGDLAAADPFEYLQRFDERTGSVTSAACFKVNASPIGLACRFLGTESFDVSRPIVLVAVLAVVVAAMYVLRRAPGASFTVFAFACLLSPMVSPVEWAHYGIMLAPMIMLLVVACVRSSPRRITLAAGLFVAYVLTQLVWFPAQSLPAQVREWLGGGREGPEEFYRTLPIGMTAQYVLAAAAFAWLLLGRQVPASRATSGANASKLS